MANQCFRCGQIWYAGHVCLVEEVKHHQLKEETVDQMRLRAKFEIGCLVDAYHCDITPVQAAEILLADAMKKNTELLKVLDAVQIRISFIGMPSEPVEWSGIVELIEKVKEK